MRERLTVRSQRTTLSGGFLDLELCFGPPTAPDLLIWIEVKHGAGLHGEQLEIYANDIENELAGEKHLILLAPRARDELKERMKRFLHVGGPPAPTPASGATPEH